MVGLFSDRFFDYGNERRIVLNFDARFDFIRYFRFIFDLKRIYERILSSLIIGIRDNNRTKYARRRLVASDLINTFSSDGIATLFSRSDFPSPAKVSSASIHRSDNGGVISETASTLWTSCRQKKNIRRITRTSGIFGNRRRVILSKGWFRESASRFRYRSPVVVRFEIKRRLRFFSGYVRSGVEYNVSSAVRPTGRKDA